MLVVKFLVIIDATFIRNWCLADKVTDDGCINWNRCGCGCASHDGLNGEQVEWIYSTSFARAACAI